MHCFLTTMFTAFIMRTMALTSILSICPLSLVDGYVHPYENCRPIIGVLSQETNSNKLSPHGKEIIPASYVKMVEAAGGRVAVIKGNQPYEYYKTIFSRINGALFTGGWVSIEPEESMYARSGKYIFDLAVEANKRGDVFPIWGTCLGFELLSYLLSGHNSLKKCFTWDQVLPLNYTKDYKNSRLFGAMPDDMSMDLGTIPLAVNYHRDCVFYKDFVRYNMNKTMKLLSTNMDYNGTEYVSTFEARDYPFFATQWHPEKIPFEFVYKNSLINTPHHSRAVEISQWMCRFFVNYVRKNDHRFPTAESENEVLIYNYDQKFVAPFGSIYETVYVIKRNVLTFDVLATTAIFGAIIFIIIYIFYKNGRCTVKSQCILCMMYKNKRTVE